jgi:ribosomal protein L11 methyltransferase
MAKKKKAKAGPAKEEGAPWRNLRVDVDQAGADWIQGLLLDERALGIQIEDDETRAVPGRAAMPTGRATIVATFGKEAGLAARVMSRLAGQAAEIPGGSGMEMSWSDLHQEDWIGNFKANYHALPLTENAWVVPSWEKDSFKAPSPDTLLIDLDPGMAFGTGSHATTSLCAKALQKKIADLKPTRLLDVGTGTGILCILAARLGVEDIVGTDIDPAALRAAAENAAKNEVATKIQLLPADADAGKNFPLVVANILANILIDLAARIAPTVAPGGKPRGRPSMRRPRRLQRCIL